MTRSVSPRLVSLRLPDSEHTSRPWRIHEVAPEFRLEDVWALPTPGGPADFPRLVRQFARGDTADNPSRLARLLFTVRWRLGARFGWDDPAAGVGAGTPSLRDRLPADLRDAPAGPAFDTLPFRPVYLTDYEWAAELANRTVHAVLHLSWVPDDGTVPTGGGTGPGPGAGIGPGIGAGIGPGIGGSAKAALNGTVPGSRERSGGYRGQLAVLVKPNTRFGQAYMAAITPFRLLVVYPPLLRGIGRTWRAGAAEHPPADQ